MKKNVLLIILIVCLARLSFAQQNISGQVKDESGESLPGATVLLIGTSRYAITDVSGNFELTVTKAPPFSLQISIVGYQKEVIPVSQLTGNRINVVLKTANVLDELIVVGYGSQSRKVLTSAVSSVSSKDLNNVGSAGFNERLQGKVAGLQINTTSGTPGSAVFVRLRGTTSINGGNDPLYVVDGVFINNNSLQSIANGGQTINPLANINPSDIESVEVLKDANATSIYGARGANGVILITTKRGKANTPSRISLDVSTGFAKAPKLWNLTTGPEHATIINEAWINDGNSFESRPYRPVGELVAGKPGRGLPEEQKTYDRQSEVFRTAPVQNYQLAVTGGDEKTNFYIGGELTNQKAIVVTDSYKRASGRFNLDHRFNSRARIGTSNLLSRTEHVLSRTSNNPKGILQASVHTPTLLPVYNPDGTYALYGIFDNYVALVKNNNNKAYGLRSVNNVFAEYDIAKNLTFHTSWSLDYNQYNERVYYNSQIADGKPSGRALSANSQDVVWINEQTLTWRNSIRDTHNFTALIGNTIQENKFERQSITATNFPSDEFQLISSSSIQTATGIKEGSGLKSFFASGNYNYKYKYILDANIRADASSRFGSGHRWGYFPSAGAAWRVSEEDFLKDSRLINELKLKTSIGVTGNQNIGNFASQGLWQAGENYLENPGISAFQLGNPNLKWETTTQFNLGVELSLLKNKISLEFDYYDKYTKDLLLNVPVPAKLGFTSVIQNQGEMSNRGVEFSLNTVNFESKDFTWKTSFNISHNKNRIEKLPVAFSQYSRDWVQLKEGYPMYSFWLYNQLRVNPETGNAVFEDVDNDGKITTNDRKIVGNAWPDFIGGFTNNLNYKGFDLSLFFNFSKGNQVYSMNRFFQEHGGTRDVSWSLLESQMDRWQKPGDITDVPRVTTKTNPDGGKNYDFQNSRFLEDGSFIRLRSLTLGYTVPSTLTRKIKVQSLRVYASATNLFLWTKYSGADPETNTAADFTNATVQGLDFATPPQPRTISFGLNLTL